MGVPLEEKVWMFGDNQSVYQSTLIPQSTLQKRWHALAYHRLRSDIATGIVNFIKIGTKQNASDILTKLMTYNDFWPHAKTMYFGMVKQSIVTSH